MSTQPCHIVGAFSFLVVAIDFTSKVMSVLADGVLVVGAVLLLLPLLKKN
ncbi:DUF3927 domain-containing protein [Escherichia coli]|nr:DUF3927 domain-containing protein [Escherichia coli]